jgi:hypothetical protein
MKTLAVGLIITLIGIGLMTSYRLPGDSLRETAIAYNTNSWTLNATLTGGDNVILLFQDNALWITNYPAGFIDSDDNPPVEILPIFIDITPISPPGSTTEWEQDLAIFNPPAGTQGYGQKMLVGWHISVTNTTATPFNTTVWLNSGGNLTQVGGIVPFTGLYSATLTCAFQNETPTYMGFLHNVTFTVYPYTNLLPAGAVTIVFGGTVSFLAARGLPFRRRSKRKWQGNTKHTINR